MRTMYVIAIIGIMIMLTGCENGDGTASGSGLIETTETVVSAEASGRIVQHHVVEGAHVKPGDTLVVIDPSRMDLELAAAKAGLEVLRTELSTARTGVRQAESAEQYARTEFKRVEKLFNSGTASDRQYDQAVFNRDQAVIASETARSRVSSLEAQITKSEADIARLERQHADFFLKAPVGGVIVEKFVDPGELLAPGGPVARIADLDTVWVKVYLPAPRFAEVKLGDHAKVDTETGEAPRDGTVIWTSEEAEFTPKNIQTEEARADLVYAVKVSIPNTDHTLKVGMPVFVTLEN